MAIRPLILAGFLVLLTIGASDALVSTENLNPPASKAISDLKDAIVKVLGFKGNEFKISGFDIRDALVGHSVSYEFDIEIDNKILPLKLIEDVNRWEYVDLPIFRAKQSSSQPIDANSLVENRRSEDPVSPVLAPFQLSGPMELWIQDAKDMRLSLPHDVEAGVLKKVILADGAVVTVKGAKSVSLRHPLDLPLPLNSSHGLLTLAEGLRNSARSQSSQLLSLRIVGPTSLTSPSSSSLSNSRLKLKRLAPGLVELSSPLMNRGIEPVSPVNEEEEVIMLQTPDRFATMWPLVSVNGSNSNLRGFETLLHSVLGSKANEEGSFKLLKVEASAQTYVKMIFEVEKELKEGDGVNWEGFPEWKTKPESVTMHFEVLGKVDGEKVVPEKVAPVNPVRLEDNILGNVFTGNMTFTETPIVYPRPDPFTL